MELTNAEVLQIIDRHIHDWQAQKASNEIALRIHRKIDTEKPTLEKIAAEIVKCEDALKALADERAALEGKE